MRTGSIYPSALAALRDEALVRPLQLRGGGCAGRGHLSSGGAVNAQPLIATDAKPVSAVPCNGCTACCQGRDLILVKPDFGDDPGEYETIPAPALFPYERQIAKKSNGDCIYLKRGEGCQIWERRPAVCRTFDCAGIVKRLGSKTIREMVRLGTLNRDVVQRGRELLRRGYRP